MNEQPELKIHVSRKKGVATVTIDNPPVNVLDVELMTELRNFLIAASTDPSLKVIVFQSADPEFFIAHVDMTLIDEPHAFDALVESEPESANIFQAFAERLRHQPQVTIVKLAGKARGGGAEFIAAADMSFAAVDRAYLAQCETLMGIVPGGGGTQYLTSRVGRHRALEIILSSDLYDAVTAERYGWINRALPQDELDVFVDRLAQNIAGLSDGVIAAAKAAVPPTDFTQGLIGEHDAWASLFVRPAATQLIRGGLANGAQTRAGEADLEGVMRRLHPTQM